MRLLVLLIAALAISCESVSLTPFPLEPCHVDGLAEEIRCGVHTVFEDRLREAGRKLSIHVAVLPALRRIVEPDREHIHHRLLALGWSARQIAILLYVVTTVLSLLALATAQVDGR